MLYVDFVATAALAEDRTEPHEPGWYVLAQSPDDENVDNVFGPQFGRKKDAELFAAGLKEKGIESYEQVDALSDDEWEAIKREIIARLQW